MNSIKLVVAMVNISTTVQLLHIPAVSPVARRQCILISNNLPFFWDLIHHQLPIQTQHFGHRLCFSLQVLEKNQTDGHLRRNYAFSITSQVTGTRDLWLNMYFPHSYVYFLIKIQNFHLKKLDPYI